MLIASCQRNKTSFSTDDYLHVIDLSKTEFEDIKLSEVFASVTPIVLETTKESLIGRTSKVIVTSEYIIVLDRTIAKALFLFRKDGTFLHKFGRIGNGPGEYSLISDFCCDNATGTIYTLDFHSNNVNMYDIHTGSFLKSIKLKNDNGFSLRIYYQMGELYTDLSNFTNKGGHLLNRRNQSTGEIEEAWFDIETYSKNVDYINGNLFLFGNGNSFKFSTYFMDGIMSVEKNKITPFLTFTPEYTLDKKVVQSIDFNDFSDMNEKLTKTGKVYGIRAYFEHKDVSFIEFSLGGLGMLTLIYNQKTKDFQVANTFFNDFFYKESNLYSSPLFIAHDDNGMYAEFGYNEINILKKHLAKDLISDNFKSTAMDLVNLEEDANPILLYYEFKD